MGSIAEWYAVKSGNCEERSEIGGGKGVEVREVERGVLAVFGVRLVLSWSILREGVGGASGESYRLRAYRKKQCFLVVNMSWKANDRGRFVMVKTRLTTEKEREVRGKGRLYTCCQRLVASERDRLG